MKVLTIQRSKWRRGGDSSDLVTRFGPTSLLNGQGNMCCLGFDALACGVPTANITDYGEPADIPCEDVPDEYVVTRIQNGNVISEAIKANDAIGLTEPEREAAVREALLKLGWDDVVFVD